MFNQVNKFFSIIIITTFISTSLYIPKAHAGEVVVPVMPKPGTMVSLSPSFTPAYLKGIVIHPDNALQFDFLINKGDGNLTDAQKKEEYNKLIKYFLASLTVADKDQWVNLSPYEKDRIIEGGFGKTEMGRDLLAQDYLLKQITSSLMYPESGLGKSFWDKVYERAFKEIGNTNIPVNTFNKVWIVPDEALVYESGNTAYVVKSHLKVMLEEDYLSLEKHTAITTKQDQTHTVASKVIKEIILPALEKEVNEGKNFAQLRQVFSGMILATWYKKALKESLLGKVYADKAKVKGVDQNPKNNEQIYQDYLAAFKKGVYNYIKEDADKYTNQTIPRKYFAGGLKNDFAQVAEFKSVSLPVLAGVVGNNDDAVMTNFDLEDAAMNTDLVTKVLAPTSAILPNNLGGNFTETASVSQEQLDKNQGDLNYNLWRDAQFVNGFRYVLEKYLGNSVKDTYFVIDTGHAHSIAVGALMKMLGIDVAYNFQRKFEADHRFSLIPVLLKDVLGLPVKDDLNSLATAIDTHRNDPWLKDKYDLSSSDFPSVEELKKRGIKKVVLLTEVPTSDKTSVLNASRTDDIGKLMWGYGQAGMEIKNFGIDDVWAFNDQNGQGQDRRFFSASPTRFQVAIFENQFFNTRPLPIRRSDSAMTGAVMRNQEIVQDSSGAYLNRVKGISEDNTSRRGFLSLLVLGVGASLLNGMPVLAQNLSSAIDPQSLNEFRSFIDRLKRSDGFRLSYDGQSVKKSFGYTSDKFADLYEQLISRVANESRQKGPFKSGQELKDAFIRHGERIIVELNGGKQAVSTVSFQPAIERIKSRLKATQSTKEIEDIILEFELLVREILKSDKSKEKEIIKSLNELSGLLLDKNYVMQQSPLGLNDEKFLVLYKVEYREKHASSSGTVDVYHVTQLTKFADGRLRGNDGWSPNFANYVIVFDEAIKRKASGMARAISTNTPIFNSASNSPEGEMIRKLSALHLSLLQKAFPKEKRNETDIANQMIEITTTHEVEHKLKEIREGHKPGTIVHNGVEEMVAILASLYRSTNPLIELIRIIEQSAGIFDNPNSAFFVQFLMQFFETNVRGQALTILNNIKADFESYDRRSLDQINVDIKQRARGMYKRILGIDFDIVRVDRAQSSEGLKGGIDMNAANMAMVIKRDGKGVPLPLAQQDMAQLSHIEGFVPRIIEIRPAISLSIFKNLEVVPSIKPNP